MQLLPRAVAYGQAGYRVHPCKPDDKRPLTSWSTSATSDPYWIARWWTTWPDALIGVCTGNGLVVIDDDRGQAQPEEDMAQTRTAKTRSRGWHHWFIHHGPPIGNRVGLIPGVDVRGEGGYVIAPPSPGWSWHNERPPQPLPDWVVTLMSANNQRGRGFGRGFAPSKTLISEGGRNDYLARFAGYVLRLELVDSINDLTEVLYDENGRVCSPSLPMPEVAAVARSIWGAEQRRNDA